MASNRAGLVSFRVAGIAPLHALAPRRGAVRNITSIPINNKFHHESKKITFFSASLRRQEMTRRFISQFRLSPVR
jgi:hypothetical protein